MKKSMKKIVALLMAVTMVTSTFSTTFAYTRVEDGKITDLNEGQKIFYAVGNMSPEPWGNAAEANIMKAVEGKDGVYSMELTFPAYDEENKWASRLAIVGNINDGDDYAVGGWTRMLVGEADYVANDSFTCLSNIRVECETETTVTVYYDSRTATVYIQDAEGNDVDYKLSWVGNDDDEQYLTVDEYAATTYDDYYAALSTDDRRTELDKINEIKPLSKALFDGTYKENVESLKKYIATGEYNTIRSEFTYDIDDGQLECTKISDKKVRITKYIGEGTQLTIPSTLFNGMEVTQIGENAFSGCSSLENIIIPDSVTYIGNYAFEGCYSLSSITIPNSVTAIGNESFYGCTSLSNIVIPNSVTYIDDRVFAGCSSLSNIVIPNSVTAIGDDSFYGCTSLSNIVIPNSVTSIGYGSFAGCSSLSSITM